MERVFAAPAVAADAAGVTEVVPLDFEQDPRVVRNGDRIVGY